MAIFEINNATDSLIQNIIRIVCLCWLIFDIFISKDPGDDTELRTSIYQNQTSFPRASETKSVTTNFYFISKISKSLPGRSRSLKKIYRVENFRANVLKSIEEIWWLSVS